MAGVAARTDGAPPRPRPRRRRRSHPRRRRRAPDRHRAAHPRSSISACDRRHALPASSRTRESSRGGGEARAQRPAPPGGLLCSARTRAAIGFCSTGSSSAAISCTRDRTARSAPGTRRGKARPAHDIDAGAVEQAERQDLDAGDPVRGPSHSGRAPSSASAWARSSPPVRMFAVPQAESARRAASRRAPARSARSAAPPSASRDARRPPSHAAIDEELPRSAARPDVHGWARRSDPARRTAHPAHAPREISAGPLRASARRR